ncbi:hypothetical protein SAMN05421647_10858 [Marinobacterium stanieri]|uniref:Uncharacterized protein n=1 Tax=Marinobacterium stanieri TaxID=49186 RepID=A0A1N6V680_9GAMM|nr:hypothetical protein SAMN05421647_10858 [Marinobacterium stanieri]
MKLHWPLIVFAALLALMLTDHSPSPAERLADADNSTLATLSQAPANQPPPRGGFPSRMGMLDSTQGLLKTVCTDKQPYGCAVHNSA